MDPLDYLAHPPHTAGAYILRADVPTMYERLKAFVYEKKFNGKGSADFIHGLYERLGVDEVRAITAFASLKSLSGQKYIIIAARSTTAEAQHGLLKAFEEGAGHSTFFFICDVGAPLLPTLISRCIVLKEDTEARKRTDTRAEDFLALPYGERLRFVEKLAKDHKREEARSLVRSLLETVAQKKYDTKKVRDILNADQYLKLTGSSIKSVLGHLALTLD